MRQKLAFLVTALALVLLLGSVAPAWATDYIDLSSLNLKVIRTEVRDEIKSTGSESAGKTLRPGEGYKLVVVTLKGAVPRSGTIVIQNEEFSSMTIEDGSPVARSSEVVARNQKWVLPPEEGKIVTTEMQRGRSGPIYISAVFLMPNEVTEFDVRYPTKAKGEAKIP